VHTIVAPDLGGKRGNRCRGDLIPLPDQADDLQATLVALDKLAQMYPATFSMLLLAAREAPRPMGIETPLNGHSPAPIAVRPEPE
jgi:hypothetical protein